MDTKYESPQPVIDTAQAVTASFVDLGEEQSMEGFTKLGLFLNIDINDSLNIQIQAIGKTKPGGTIEYLLPIRSANFSAGQVGVKTFILEMVDDINQGIILEVETGNLIPFVQLQVKALTVGAAAGQISNALVSKSYV